MRLRHGDPCASTGAQLGDVQPVEVVRRQALAPGEDGDLEPPSSQCPQLRGRRGLHVAEGEYIACQTWIEGMFVRPFTQSPAGLVRQIHGESTAITYRPGGRRRDCAQPERAEGIPRGPIALPAASW